VLFESGELKFNAHSNKGMNITWGHAPHSPDIHVGSSTKYAVPDGSKGWSQHLQFRSFPTFHAFVMFVFFPHIGINVTRLGGTIWTKRTCVCTHAKGPSRPNYGTRNQKVSTEKLTCMREVSDSNPSREQDILTARVWGFP
jgi:hypothetical protein